MNERMEKGAGSVACGACAFGRRVYKAPGYIDCARRGQVMLPEDGCGEGRAREKGTEEIRDSGGKPPHGGKRAAVSGATAALAARENKRGVGNRQ